MHGASVNSKNMNEWTKEKREEEKKSEKETAKKLR